MVMGESVWETIGVFGRLCFHPGESVTFGFRLDDPNGFTIGIEHVIREPTLERELTNSHSRPGHDVHGLSIMDKPATLLELAVDLLTCFLFGSHYVT